MREVEWYQCAGVLVGVVQWHGSSGGRIKANVNCYSLKGKIVKNRMISIFKRLVLFQKGKEK